MTAFCALMLVARAGTADTGSTGTSPPTADTGTVGGTTTPPLETGLNGGSGGPGTTTTDTGSVEDQTVLAADLAKELGGIGCVVTPGPATWWWVAVGAGALLVRRKP